MFISTNSSVRDLGLGLVRNAKRLDFSKGNCKVAWNRIFNKYASHTILLLLKLKCEFYNSELDSTEKGLDESILNIDELYSSNSWTIKPSFLSIIFDTGHLFLPLDDVSFCEHVDNMISGAVNM